MRAGKPHLYLRDSPESDHPACAGKVNYNEGGSTGYRITSCVRESVIVLARLYMIRIIPACAGKSAISAVLYASDQITLACREKLKNLCSSPSVGITPACAGKRLCEGERQNCQDACVCRKSMRLQLPSYTAGSPLRVQEKRSPFQMNL